MSALRQRLIGRFRHTRARRLYDYYSLARWRLQGRPIPPPYAYKRQVIRQHARQFGCAILVETGTFNGDTPWALRGDFERIFSIELDERLHQLARRRLSRYPNIELIQGDSGTRLAEVAARLSTKALFWLDGHYCGRGTGRAALDSPIIAELDVVLAHPVGGHVVLIDDARDFNGSAGYPTIGQIESWVRRRRDDLSVSVEHDMIRICPAQPRPPGG
jgi:hypothetical protein